MATLTPEAQKGLDYLKKANPALAASISSTSGLSAPASNPFSQPTTPIDVSALSSPPNVNVPSLPISPIPDISTLRIQNTTRQDALQAERSALKSDITDAQEKLAGKSARKAELETQADIPGLSAQLNEINKQIGQVQSEALAEYQKSEDRFAPTFAIRGEQAQIERQRAVRVYGLSAASEALQGNIALANDQVQRALDAEFGGIEQEIENAKYLIELNKDEFNTEESRRAETTLAALNERERLLAEQKEEKKSVYDVLKLASQYGAPPTVLNKILASTSYADAVLAADSYLQDPKAQLELEGMRLDQLLTRTQIAKAQKETSLLGQPSAKELAEQQASRQAAKDAIPAITDKINSISSLLVHPGLRGSVGAYGVARWTPLSPDKAERQDFIAGVQQLVKRETLDTLINLKAAGGTLGALSDSEREMLEQAASKINTWAITKDGKVVGYEIDEESFKRELQTIQNLAIRARDKAVGNGGFVTTDERDAIEQFLSAPTAGSTPSNFNPQLYFN